MVENSSRCQQLRRDGHRCQGPARPSGFCFAHDPALREERKAASARGGQNKSKAVRAQKLLPNDLQALDKVLAQAIDGVYAGHLLPNRGSAIAALAGARVRVREIGLKLAEQSELLDRISRLEERINEIGFTARTNGTGSRGLPRL
jgi:hypothetical protein